MSEQERFLEASQFIAMYGLSRTGKGFAYNVRDAIKRHNPQIRLCAIHPDCPQLAGLMVYASAEQVVPRPDAAIVVLPPEKARHALDDIARSGIHHVWLVLEAASAANLDYAGNLGLEATRGCPMLYLEDAGFPHNLHQWIAKLFKTM
jgi:predicted CoA-binding protein